MAVSSVNDKGTFVIFDEEGSFVILGTNKALAGSALWRLSYEMLPGGPSSNCSAAFEEILSHYEAGSTQLTSLSPSQFCLPAKHKGGVTAPTSQYPSLKGRGIEVKHIIIPLTTVFKKHVRRGNDDDRDLLCVL